MRMAGALMPCGGCSRHVRITERSCPFCGVALALIEPVQELRLLTRLDRSRMVALGALLSAAGIALGCREQVVAVYGAPPTPVLAPSAAPSAAPPALEVPPAPSASAAAPAAPPPSQSSAVLVPVPKQSAAPKATSAPTGAPAAAYGAPPRMPGPGSDPTQR